MTNYPKETFEIVEKLRNRYERHTTSGKREDLAWWVEVLASKVSAWVLQERLKSARDSIKTVQVRF